MKKILLAVWTFTLGFVANAADSITSPSPTIMHSYSKAPLAHAGDGTGTCLAERAVGEGTGTCLSARTSLELIQLNRLHESLKARSIEEKEIILNKLEEILNDDISN